MLSMMPGAAVHLAVGADADDVVAASSEVPQAARGNASRKNRGDVPPFPTDELGGVEAKTFPKPPIIFPSGTPRAASKSSFWPCFFAFPPGRSRGARGDPRDY
jgi:hypothetical protein